MNKKRLKLPNGYGSIACRHDSRRRNPYVVKVTVGGKQKAIGYVATYEDGLMMLAEYHKDPTRFITSNITFAEVYQLMSAEKYKQIAEVTAKIITQHSKTVAVFITKSFPRYAPLICKKQ